MPGLQVPFWLLLKGQSVAVELSHYSGISDRFNKNERERMKVRAKQRHVSIMGLISPRYTYWKA